jgi:hypothetical protein
MAMDAAIPGRGTMWRLRNFVFFTAVLLMFYTLEKPSPVDVAFVAALALSPFVNQKITQNFLLYVLVMGAWTLSFHIAAQPVLRDPDVPFELVQKTYAVLLGMLACLTAVSWNRTQFLTFLKIYVVSCVIASFLGIAGFATGLELLSWDGRAKGLINDPNMYAAFLTPGALACLYLNGRTKFRGLVIIAAGIIMLGLMLSFSRVAIVGFVLCAGLYLFVANRRNLRQLVLFTAGGFAGLAIVLALLFAVGGENFTKRVEDRLTFAKSYDLGREGRFSRYGRSVPIIVANPRGIGALQDGKIFVEAIHNIFIGSFLLHGWIAGFAWLSFFVMSIFITIRNQMATADPLPTLLFCCLLSAVMGATLHEGEHWRPLWIFGGLVWGLNVRTAAQLIRAESYDGSLAQSA